MSSYPLSAGIPANVTPPIFPNDTWYHGPNSRLPTYQSPGSCNADAQQAGVTSMAQKLRTLFTDDLDGTPAEGTVRFALDGTEYEIDLTAEHAQALRNTLARYVAAARRSPASPRPARARRAAGSRPVSGSEVRAWAKSQGMEVKQRGRMPAELVVKFKAATEK